MKRRIISVIALISLVIMLLPTTALADTRTLTGGTSSDSAFDISTLNSGDVLSIQTDSTVYLTGSQNITITCTENANLVLENVTIVSDGCPITFAAGTANTITLSGTNTLTAAGTNPGIYVPSGVSLTIEDGSGDGSGSLSATGSANSAGIGGKNGASGTITINGGAINATGGQYGAGIGGGARGAGTVEIYGGEITASGGTNATGIGGGYNAGANVIMTGGTITSAVGGGNSSSGGAGIGGGYAGSATVTITGGTITSAIGGGTKSGGGAGIGGGEVANSGGSTGKIKFFQDATVFASGSPNDIGDGSGNSGAVIRIGGTAAKIFLYHDTYATELRTDTHVHTTADAVVTQSETITGNAACGVTGFPDSWNGRTAQGYLPECTVTFDPNYAGAATSTVTAGIGELLVAPTITREGYTITAWCTDSGGTHPFDFDKDRASDGLTLYAAWTNDASLVYGSVVVTGPERVAYTGAASYAVPYTATYTMSQNFADQVASDEAAINRYPGSMTFTFTVNLDSALTPEMSGSSYVYARSDGSLSSTGSITVTVPVAPNTINVPANTCKTELTKSTLTIEKTVAGSGMPTTSTEFTFTVTPTSGTISGTYTIGSGTAIYTIPSSGQISLTAGETATLTGLDAGDYTVAETTPSGTAAVNYTGTQYTVDSGAATTGTAASVTVAAGAATALAFTNHYYYSGSSGSSGGGDSDDSDTYSVTLTKVDEDSSTTYLSGAEFQLYKNNGTSVGSYTTNSSGKFTVTSLDDGSYYFVETAAPSGYELDTAKHSFTIRGANATLTVTNTKSSADTPSALNSTDHFKYVVGYADGTVRPNGNVTRAEVATMFYRLLTASRRDAIFTGNNSFSDVTSDLWYNKAVSSMAAGGYVTGYSDGSFGGNKAITRAEFVAIASRFMGAQSQTVSFTDVPTAYWAYQDISTAVYYGWIEGYSDSTFQPDQPITRAEVMTIINRILHRGVEADGVMTGFKEWPDNDSSAWYYYEVIEATNDHEYTGTRPSEQWTSLTTDYTYDIAKYEKP